MTPDEIAAVLRASSLGELVWLDGHGQVGVRGVIALTRGTTPVLAFSYAEEERARAVAASAEVCLLVRDTRSTGPAFEPLLLRGRPTLTADPTGEVFTDGLLDQELRRHPPSRAYADSPLLRREYWWFLPRLLVEVDVQHVERLAGRREHAHLLAVAGGGKVDVRVVTVRPEHHAERVVPDLGEALPPAPGPAILFGQDASVPDLEVWSQWTFRGTWDGDGLVVHTRPAQVGLAKTPSMLQRWRRQRELERRCRRAIPHKA